MLAPWTITTDVIWPNRRASRGWTRIAAIVPSAVIANTALSWVRSSPNLRLYEHVEERDDLAGADRDQEARRSRSLREPARSRIVMPEERLRRRGDRAGRRPARRAAACAPRRSCAAGRRTGTGRRARPSREQDRHEHEDDPVRPRTSGIHTQAGRDHRGHDAAQDRRDDVGDVLDRELDGEQLVAVLGLAVLGQVRRDDHAERVVAGGPEHRRHDDQRQRGPRSEEHAQGDERRRRAPATKTTRRPTRSDDRAGGEGDEPAGDRRQGRRRGRSRLWRAERRRGTG